DDPRILQVCRWALEDEGFVVETADDGPVALQFAQERPPALVVLDVTLPTANGNAVVQGLQASGRAVPPILVMTGDGQARQKAAELGAYEYVRKPFDVNEFVAAVQRGLGAS
ncbi:MAG TPA: response regulator, partial [Chloroflexota bacterium]